MGKSKPKRDFSRAAILAHAKATVADFRGVVGTRDFLLYLLNCVVGAAIGLVTFLLRPPDVISLCAAVLVTVLVCTFFRLGTATRTALAALVAGSLVALLLTFATTSIVRKTQRPSPERTEEETNSPE